MSVYRIEKIEGFTTMCNYHLRDDRLSLKARGLLSMILSLPPDWDFSITGFCACCKEGRDSIRSALEELETAGYIERDLTERDGGKFTGGSYTIYEVPPDELHRVGLTDAVYPHRKTRRNKYTEELSIDNIPPIVPQGDSADSADESTPDGEAAPKQKPRRGKKTAWKPERFEAFWSYYPGGGSKDRARKAWDKLRLSDEEIDEMALRLRLQMRSPEWQRGIGIPYASTYLNGRRWNDRPRSACVEAEDTPNVPPGGEVSVGW